MTKRALIWSFVATVAVTAVTAALAEATAQHWLWIIATVFVLIALAIGKMIVGLP